MVDKQATVDRVLVYWIVALLSFAFMSFSLPNQSMNWTNKNLKCCNWCFDTPWICYNLSCYEQVYPILYLCYGLIYISVTVILILCIYLYLLCNTPPLPCYICSALSPYICKQTALFMKIWHRLNMLEIDLPGMCMSRTKNTPTNSVYG